MRGGDFLYNLVMVCK